jgi:hypothetical protein
MNGGSALFVSSREQITYDELGMHLFISIPPSTKPSELPTLEQIGDRSSSRYRHIS